MGRPCDFVSAQKRLIRLRPTVDWDKCEGRHDNARYQEQLGNERPYTDWKEGGGVTLREGVWSSFFKSQPERVLDLVETTMKRKAKLGVDSTGKV